VIATPQPTATAAGPLVTRFSDDLLRSSWQLDGVVVGGQMQPPWNDDQCMAVGYRPEEYYFYTGCNHGYCDPGRSGEVKPGEPLVVCTVTVAGCFTTPEPATGKREQVPWEQPFADAMMQRRTAEVRDAKLWLSADDTAQPVLVFRRVDTCEGEQNYLRP
jgi:hypothetical protein